MKRIEIIPVSCFNGLHIPDEIELYLIGNVVDQEVIDDLIKHSRN